MWTEMFYCLVGIPELSFAESEQLDSERDISPEMMDLRLLIVIYLHVLSM